MDYIDKNRDFKGVWIPKEIWLNENLTMIEKVILIEIDSLDNEEHCSAGNDYLAQFCQCSEWKVSAAIKKLQELGYIEVISFDGRRRKLRSCLKKIQRQTLENPKADSEIQRQTLENPKADSGKSKAININNNLDNNAHCYLHNNEPMAQVSETTSSTSSSNNNSPDKSFCKESTDSYIATPQAQEPIWVQDKAIESYVLNLTSIDKETKDYLLGWVQQNLNSKCLTVAKLRIILKDLYAQCNNDISLVSESIKNSYLKNWKNFYVPDSIEKQQHIEKPVEQQKQEEECEVITDLNAWLNS